jgi:thymidylate synthase
MPEIESDSISDVWSSAVVLATKTRGHEVMNLNATVTGLDRGGPDENAEMRSLLDEMLSAAEMASVETVANTIFPNSLWNPRRPKEELFARYMKAFPKIRRHPANRRGTYFERMINYPSGNGEKFNQLKQVIETYLAGNHRRSALQASVIIPWKDLNNARQQGFPCMQQVAFVPTTAAGTLMVVGFYPHQYLFERAFGNYLGLIRLGRFVAHEMQLTLSAMTCVSTIADLEVSARAIAPILELAQR